MTDKPNYRFSFQIIDQTTDDVVIADYCSILGSIDEHGGNESVDHPVARMLRMFERSARAEYEAANYQVPA